MSADQTLHTIFDFTPDDLHANQEGQVSPKQLARLRRLALTSYRLLMVIIILLGVSWVGVFVWGDFRANGIPLSIAGIATLVFFGFLSLLLSPLQNNVDRHAGLRIDLKNPQVNVVVGQPTLLPPKTYQRMTWYAIGLSGWQLYVTEKQYTAFAAFLGKHPEQDFAVFFLPHSKRVLSMQMTGLAAEDYFDDVDA